VRVHRSGRVWSLCSAGCFLRSRLGGPGEEASEVPDCMYATRSPACVLDMAAHRPRISTAYRWSLVRLSAGSARKASEIPERPARDPGGHFAVTGAASPISRPEDNRLGPWEEDDKKRSKHRRPGSSSRSATTRRTTFPASSLASRPISPAGHTPRRRSGTERVLARAGTGPVPAPRPTRRPTSHALRGNTASAPQSAGPPARLVGIPATACAPTSAAARQDR
jgi:hypothetical protein